MSWIASQQALIYSNFNLNMDESANIMRNARETFREGLIEFMSKCNPSDTTQLFCFVEGNIDKCFYNSKVRAIIDISPSSIICRKKTNVLSIYDEINKRKEYSGVPIGYFIDRDFDNSCEMKDVYETPCYSIENFYVQEETVRAILEDAFMIDSHGEDYATALDLYQKLIETFHQKTLLLNSWLCCQSETDIGHHSKLHIDNTVEKSFKRIVMPDMTGIAAFPDFETKQMIEELFNHVPPVDLSVVEKKVEFFRDQNHSYIFRGKFELEILASFLQRLRETLVSADGVTCKKSYKPVIHFEKNQILYQFVDKVIITKCLRAYIQKLAA
jgi:hypothetical protein